MTEPTTYLVAYTRLIRVEGEQPHVELGVARVSSTRLRPSWSDCHSQIPHFLTGHCLGAVEVTR